MALPTMPGMSPLPGTPPIPQMPDLNASFLPKLSAPAAVPNTPPQTPQPPQPAPLPGTSPTPAPAGATQLPPAGAGILGALRNNLPVFGGPAQIPGIYSPAAQHAMAMNGWQDKLGSAVFGGGMTPGSGVGGYFRNLAGVAGSRPAPEHTPGMLSHLFGPYTGSNNGGTTST